MKRIENPITLEHLACAGVISGLQLHSVAWLLNNNFSLDLSRVDPLVTPQSEYNFCYQRFEDVNLQWFLIENKGLMRYFIKSRPLFDYVLMVRGEDHNKYFRRALEALLTTLDIRSYYIFEARRVDESEMNALLTLNYRNLQKQIYVQSPV
jgi:hypothetical protein